MTKGYVHLSQEVVSCLLRREKRINVSVYLLSVSILRSVSLQIEKGPGPDVGEQGGWVEGRDPGEAQTAVASETSEPKASHT